MDVSKPEEDAGPEWQAGDPGLQGWVEYLRDMGIADLYRTGTPKLVLSAEVLAKLTASAPLKQGNTARNGEATQTIAAVRPSSAVAPSSPPNAFRYAVAEVSGGARVTAPAVARIAVPPSQISSPLRTEDPDASRTYFGESQGMPQLPPELAAPMPKPKPLEDVLPIPQVTVPVEARAAALAQLQTEIGDCTRCPLAYAGRHTIVFGEGDPSAELMFVGEGPGADEDASGRPFVGKAGQLLTNMIGAMGLGREQVFIANIVKCRPPGNRTPEFIEATTCSQFLLKQIDIVRPKVIVALGSTAATYVLGVKQSLSGLRGQWFSSRGAKVAVTYHPAFLLRDPRQKAEAWKDLQRVMAELGLRGAKG